MSDPRARRELLDIAARNGTLAGWVTIAFVVVVYLLIRGAADERALTVWIVAMAIASAVRIVVCQAWRQRGSRRDETMPSGPQRIDLRRLRRWEIVQAVVAFGCGATWSALVFAVAPGSERAEFLVGLALTVALVLASNSYAASRLGHLLFSLPIVVLQEVHLLRLETHFHDLFVVAWPFLVVVLVAFHRASSRSLLENLVARIDHERRAVEQDALVGTAPLGILVVRDGRIVVCNDALLKLVGYDDCSQLFGRSVRMLMPDEAAWQQALKDSAEAAIGPIPARIVRRLRGDGVVVELKLNMAAVHAGTSETEYIGIYEDINERMAIEEGFRHAVRMQRLVFESAGDGIAIVHDGTIEQANPALEDLIGSPAGQLTGRPLASLFEDPHGWIEIERRFQRLDTTLKLERRIVRSDGRSLWAHVTGRPVDDWGSGAPADDKRSIWILADLSLQKEKEAENWHHANHDVMTGLPNRRFLQDRLDQALAFARRDGRRVAVIELDLDGFKSVNDTHGHRFGDAVLEEVARRLSSVVRELDTVGRWGGDEFVLVLKEIESPEVVEETVKRVIARLTEPIVYRDRHLAIGASIGVALYPDHGDGVETLMLAADLAMYESKAAGGNAWRFSTAAIEPPRGKYRPALPTR